MSQAALRTGLGGKWPAGRWLSTVPGAACRSDSRRGARGAAGAWQSRANCRSQTSGALLRCPFKHANRQRHRFLQAGRNLFLFFQGYVMARKKGLSTELFQRYVSKTEQDHLGFFPFLPFSGYFPVGTMGQFRFFLAVAAIRKSHSAPS